MIFRFNSKPTRNGWTYQLEYNDETKEYEYGTYIFLSGDVEGMTKKQLDRMVRHLQGNGYHQAKKKGEKSENNIWHKSATNPPFEVYTKEVGVCDLGGQYKDFYVEICVEEEMCVFYLCHKRNAVKRSMFKCLLSEIEGLDINTYISLIIKEEIRRFAYVHMDDDYFDVMEMLGIPIVVDEDDDICQGSQYVSCNVINAEEINDAISEEK